MKFPFIEFITTTGKPVQVNVTSIISISRGQYDNRDSRAPIVYYTRIVVQGGTNYDLNIKDVKDEYEDVCARIKAWYVNWEYDVVV